MSNDRQEKEPPAAAPVSLIVEPNRGALGRSIEALEEAGLTARGCAEIEEAVALLEAHGEDAIEVVVLSVTEGFEAEQVSLALETLPEPRPALLTIFPKGSDVVEMESEAERLGAQGALARPVPLRALGLTAWALAQMVAAHRERQAAGKAAASLEEAAAPVDPRTHLYRFEHFKPLLAAELKRARRYGIPFTLLRVAFDSLAEVELAHGAEMVETLEGGLRLAVSRALRDQDIAVDLGPGHILAVLPHTGHRGARSAAERIRRRVAKTRLTLIEGSAGTTASIGIAVYRGKGDVSFAQMIREATDAVAIAQDAGGNRAAEVPLTRRK
ncbi:MAG: GGDEF domain-containing protein [Deltaproteobacteria bacterium]|nr:GGDEF domain-containing protein [Deltaproteobacteria bacterium]